MSRTTKKYRKLLLLALCIMMAIAYAGRAIADDLDPHGAVGSDVSSAIQVEHGETIVREIKYGHHVWKIYATEGTNLEVRLAPLNDDYSKYGSVSSLNLYGPELESIGSIHDDRARSLVQDDYLNYGRASVAYTVVKTGWYYIDVYDGGTATYQMYVHNGSGSIGTSITKAPTVMPDSEYLYELGPIGRDINQAISLRQGDTVVRTIEYGHNIWAAYCNAGDLIDVRVTPPQDDYSKYGSISSLSLLGPDTWSIYQDDLRPLAKDDYLNYGRASVSYNVVKTGWYYIDVYDGGTATYQLNVVSAGGGTGGTPSSSTSTTQRTTTTTKPATTTTTLQPTTSTTVKDMRVVNFVDVTINSWYYIYVNDLVTMNVISGYEDGTFRPEVNVTRAEFARMICGAMGWNEDNSPSSFSDISDSHWACGYIEAARANGAINGYPDGRFRPGDKITRAEIAKILATSLSLNSGSSSLRDISGHWAKDYINACVSASIISGYTDGTFKPNANANRAEAAKMISRAAQ